MDIDTTTTATPATDDGSDVSGTQSDDTQTYDFLKDGDTFDDILKKDILELMGFTELTDEKRAELHKKVEDGIERRIAVRILDALTEEDSVKYDEMLQREQNEEAKKFLDEKGISLEKITSQEIIMMKLELYQDGHLVKDKAIEYLAKQKDDKGKSGE